ncbi:MAG TPA: type II toxin-antitoxin system death-on-curing family toxin [Tepidisphaeraceae bacterium]|nr:type II toxin-antitoxin system death-on-curing family toxin [Tepidisphaeraceae bacterium]
MAAAYLFHLAGNHPFADGNKRTAAQGAALFLAMNNRPIEYPIDEAERVTLGVANGTLSKDDVARFFRRLLGAA